MTAFSKIVSTITLWKLLAGNLSCKEQAKDIGKEIANSDKGSEGKRKRQFDWRGQSRKIATSNANITIHNSLRAIYIRTSGMTTRGAEV